MTMLVLSMLFAAAGQSHLSYEGRDLVVYEPANMPATGSRALVIVLHGGMGNADRIAGRQNEKGLNLDSVAEKNGFLVAYLNGTKVARLLGDDKKGWNAGDCCGLPASTEVDDVKYLSGVVAFLAQKYGVDLKRVFGMGHSNGAMMTMRMLCETDVLAAGMPISGALGIDPAKCTHAKGKRIEALIGENDENVPLKGGRGKGLSKTDFKSQEATRQAFVAAGAAYQLQILPGAQHSFETIEKAVEQRDKVTVAEKAARFFGLSK